MNILTEPVAIISIVLHTICVSMSELFGDDDSRRYFPSIYRIPPDENENENPNFDQILETMKQWSAKFPKLVCQPTGENLKKLFDSVQWEEDGLREVLEKKINDLFLFAIKYDSHPSNPDTSIKLWRAFVKKIDANSDEELIYIGHIMQQNVIQLLSSSELYFRVKEVFFSEQGAFRAWCGGCDLWRVSNKPYGACCYLELNQAIHRIEVLP